MAAPPRVLVSGGLEVAFALRAAPPAEIAGREPPMRFAPGSTVVREELNRAAFARGPLRAVGEPALKGEERMGVSPLRRGAKKLMGLGVPWRFGSGRAFRAGFARDAMDLGLRVLRRRPAE